MLKCWIYHGYGKLICCFVILYCSTFEFFYCFEWWYIQLFCTTCLILVILCIYYVELVGHVMRYNIIVPLSCYTFICWPIQYHIIGLCIFIGEVHFCSWMHWTFQSMLLGMSTYIDVLYDWVGFSCCLDDEVHDVDYAHVYFQLICCQIIHT